MRLFRIERSGYPVIWRFRSIFIWIFCSRWNLSGFLSVFELLEGSLMMKVLGYSGLKGIEGHWALENQAGILPRQFNDQIQGFSFKFLTFKKHFNKSPAIFLLILHQMLSKSISNETKNYFLQSNQNQKQEKNSQNFLRNSQQNERKQKPSSRRKSLKFNLVIYFHPQGAKGTTRRNKKKFFSLFCSINRIIFKWGGIRWHSFGLLTRTKFAFF